MSSDAKETTDLNHNVDRAEGAGMSRTRTVRVALKERIRTHYRAGVTDYNLLMQACFPPETHPEAFGYPTRGGPPGCAMAFNRALSEMNGGYTFPERKIWFRS